MGVLNDKWNKNSFSIYDSEEKTTLKLIENIKNFLGNDVITTIDKNKEDLTKELNTKTNNNGDHKGSWQGLNRPTLSEEGMRATVEKLDTEVNTILKSGQVNVLAMGLDNTGTVDNTDLFMQLIEQYNNFYFPNGTYLFNSTISINKDITITGERNNTTLTTTGKYAIFKFLSGNTIIKDLKFLTTGTERTEFTVYSINTSSLLVEGCYFNNTNGQESGLRIEKAVTSLIDKCYFNHANISLKTWDCKISNTWIWALWRPYGVGVFGGSGNITMQNVDIVPPFRTQSGIKNSTEIGGIKAGIWINTNSDGVVNNVIMEGVYFDGNPTLDTGVGLLCESAFNITLSDYKANKMNSNVIVIDSCYNVTINNGMHYENNKYDHQAYEILVKKVIGSKCDSILINGCHFINYTTDKVTKPTPAIKIDSTADRSTKIVNCYIRQDSVGNVYGIKEIDVVTIPKELYTNVGTKSVYYTEGTLEYSGAGKTLSAPSPLAYKPMQKDYEFSCENGFTPNFRVQQTDNVSSWIATKESVDTPITIYYRIKLGK